MAAVDAIADTPIAAGDGGEMSKPVTPPVMKTVTIRP